MMFLTSQAQKIDELVDKSLLIFAEAFKEEMEWLDSMSARPAPAENEHRSKDIAASRRQSRNEMDKQAMTALDMVPSSDHEESVSRIDPPQSSIPPLPVVQIQPLETNQTIILDAIPQTQYEILPAPPLLPNHGTQEDLVMEEPLNVAMDSVNNEPDANTQPTERLNESSVPIQSFSPIQKISTGSTFSQVNISGISELGNASSAFIGAENSSITGEMSDILNGSNETAILTHEASSRGSERAKRNLKADAVQVENLESSPAKRLKGHLSINQEDISQAQGRSARPVPSITSTKLLTMLKGKGKSLDPAHTEQAVPMLNIPTPTAVQAERPINVPEKGTQSSDIMVLKASERPALASVQTKLASSLELVRKGLQEQKNRTRVPLSVPESTPVPLNMARDEIDATQTVDMEQGEVNTHLTNVDSAPNEVDTDHISVQVPATNIAIVEERTQTANSANSTVENVNEVLPSDFFLAPVANVEMQNIDHVESEDLLLDQAPPLFPADLVDSVPESGANNQESPATDDMVFTSTTQMPVSAVPMSDSQVSNPLSDEAVDAQVQNPKTVLHILSADTTAAKINGKILQSAKNKVAPTAPKPAPKLIGSKSGPIPLKHGILKSSAPKKVAPVKPASSLQSSKLQANSKPVGRPITIPGAAEIQSKLPTANTAGAKHVLLLIFRRFLLSMKYLNAGYKQQSCPPLLRHLESMLLLSMRKWLKHNQLKLLRLLIQY